MKLIWKAAFCRFSQLGPRPESCFHSSSIHFYLEIRKKGVTLPIFSLPNVIDDRGYSQLFLPSKAMDLRTFRRADAIIKQMAGSRGAETSVLELGCGTGELSALIASRTGAQVLGIDLCQPFIAQATERHQLPNLSFKTCDLNRDSWAEDLGQQFDYIVGNGILHHLYHQLDDVLPKFRAVLKTGGRMVFWEPNLLNPYVYFIFSYERLRQITKLEPAEMAFTPAFIRRKLKRAGFSSADVSCRDFLLPITPSLLIQPLVRVGSVLERLPGLRAMAQSLFILAE
jgi:2-polyprenyl-3-methyl-5-hydroxy-6-metoxy-1,4-benzoquinol methylase